MLLLVPLVALVLGITSGADDFDVTAHPFHQGHFVSYDEFEFVYHHSHDLLLVMHDNKCYFGKLIDNSGDEDRMMDNDNYRRFMEGHLMRVLPDGYFHLPVQDSDLTAMRDEFQDLLANFRCEDTDIYTFEMEVKMRDNPQFHMPELCLRTRPSASSQWSSWSASDPRWCSGDTHSTGGSQVLTTGAKDFDVTAHPLQPDVHHPGRFVSNVYDEFEFVYHSSHDLLLVMHNNKCYFGKLVDNRGAEDRMMDSDQYTQQMERYLMRVLPKGFIQVPVQHTNLTAMTYEFHDQLANGRCEHKDIYTFEMEVNMKVDHQLHGPDKLCLRTRPSASSQWSSWNDPYSCPDYNGYPFVG